MVTDVNLRGLFRGNRQQYIHAGSASGLAIHMDESAVASHDLVNCGQSQARALLCLGCEERFEQVRSSVAVHADAVILDGDQRAWEKGGRVAAQ